MGGTTGLTTPVGQLKDLNLGLAPVHGLFRRVQGNFEKDWAQRTPVTALSWPTSEGRWVHDYWVGTLSQTGDAYSCSDPYSFTRCGAERTISRATIVQWPYRYPKYDWHRQRWLWAAIPRFLLSTPRTFRCSSPVMQALATRPSRQREAAIAAPQLRLNLAAGLFWRACRCGG